MMFSMLASVVVLPEPVGPVTRIMPRGLCSRSLMVGGRPISSSVSRRDGIRRSTSPTVPFCQKALTRKRPLSW
jgi:hypothetical protein